MSLLALQHKSCRSCILCDSDVRHIGPGHLYIQVVRRDLQLALSEVTHREGILAGSTNMDIMFMDYAKDLLGQEHFEHWAAHNPRDVAKLKYKAWEEAKVAFDGTEGATIDPMPSLVRAIPDEVPSPLPPSPFTLINDACYPSSVW